MGEKLRKDNRELYLDTEKLSGTILKRKIAFYGHVVQMNKKEDK